MTFCIFGRKRAKKKEAERQAEIATERATEEKKNRETIAKLPGGLPSGSDDELMKYLLNELKCYLIVDFAVNENVVVLWTGWKDENQLVVYDWQTRQILYSEVLCCRDSWDYNVKSIAEEFIQDKFLNGGDCLYFRTQYPPGVYGKIGFIRDLTEAEKNKTKTYYKKSSY